MEPVINVQHVGKKFNITHTQAGGVLLSEKIHQFLKNPFKKKDTSTIEEFWALKNVSFSINKGEVVGIIGKNGAGKSTILKILAGITRPTEGVVTIKGKVSSLLEVGTGFHPELSGRENIYLNGSILGMSKKEIATKFDQIVDFAGVEKFLDTPVKHYSSGMYMRLAFSVAAHLEPDILIVDEVLSVGDAEFQRKCLGKIEESTEKLGRTIIIVSHDLNVLQSVCTKIIYLKEGKIVTIGEPLPVINTYVQSIASLVAEYTFPHAEKDAYITKVVMRNERNNIVACFSISEKIYIEVTYTVRKQIRGVVFCFLFYMGSKLIYAATEADIDGILRTYESGSYSATIELPSQFLNIGMYHFGINLQRPGVDFIASKEGFNFKIVNDATNKRDALFGGKVYGHMAALLPVKVRKE